MSIFDPLFGKKLYRPQPNDVKMWQSAQRTRICEPCKCLEPQYGNARFGNLLLHAESQDKDCEGWKLLESLIEEASTSRSREFAPGLVMPPNLWSQIITLPSSISKLTHVKKLYLYGSNLVRIPQEIGEMESLEELDIYTSYRLHWLPYEVTRCRKLKQSRASTRTLYGNYKYRPPFPRLGTEETKPFASAACSICANHFPVETLHQVWLSLRVATDVFPLLVNACSKECIGRLPPPAQGYIDRPHTGGLGVQQPPRK